MLNAYNQSNHIVVVIIIMREFIECNLAITACIVNLSMTKMALSDHVPSMTSGAW